MPWSGTVLYLWKLLGNQCRKAAKGKVHFLSAKVWFIGAADSRICQEYLVRGLGILVGYSSSRLLPRGKVGCLNSVLRRVAWGRCEFRWPCCSAAKLILRNFFSIMKRLAWNYFVCLFCLALYFLSLLFFFLACVLLFFLAAWLHVRLLFIAFPQQMESHFSVKCVTAKEHEAVFLCEDF